MRFFSALLIAALAVAANDVPTVAPSPAIGKPTPARVEARSAAAAANTLPAWRLPFSGPVTRISDADTLFVRRPDGVDVKVRLHWIDAPEIAHNSKELDQPGGREALAWAQKRWLGKTVDVVPKSRSYDRIVADVTLADVTTADVPAVSLAKELAAMGRGMLDRRYKPPADFLAAEAAAKQAGLGIWAQKNPTPPWEWRKLSREAQRKRTK